MQRARPRRPGPSRFRTCPAPTTRFPAAEPPPSLATAAVQGWQGRGFACFTFLPPLPVVEAAALLPRLPESPAAAADSSRQPTQDLTWFTSSHKTRTASQTRPLGAASAVHWLRPRS